MDSKPDRRVAIAVTVVALALSAIGLYLGTGLDPVWRFMWAAPIPVLMVAHRVKPLAAFAAGFGVWFLGGLNMWTYMRDDIKIPVAVVVAFMAIPAVIFGLAALLSRALVVRDRIWAGAIAVPAVWVAVEFLVSVVSPHGTFGSLAYTQMDFLPAVQLASVFGVLGISFLVLLVPSTVAVVLSARGSTRSRAGVGVGCAALALAALGFGLFRLGTASSSADTITVGLAAADRPGPMLPASDLAAREILTSYAASLDGLAARGARVAVLPETIVAVSSGEIAHVEKLFKDVAERHSMTIVVGLDWETEKSEHNAALAFGPGDAEPAPYAKHHLVPGLEAQYEPGSGLAVLEGSDPLQGVAICKDLDFPALGRQYGEQGVDVLLVPAWDFDRDGWLHSRIAMMRGVESGFAIARSARRGLLTVSDAWGRVLAEAGSNSAPVATAVASLPIERVDTLYSRFGDWFGWVCVAVVAVVITRAVARPKGR